MPEKFHVKTITFPGQFFAPPASEQQFLACPTDGATMPAMRAVKRDRTPVSEAEVDAVLHVLHTVVRAATVQVERACGGRLGMGSCHLIWQEQARLLSDRYGIEWMSPSDMNPDAVFD